MPNPTSGKARLPALAARVAPWVALALAAAAPRLTSWNDVFTRDGVRFVGDSDTYYHALRAKRLIDEFPHVSLEDPWMNYPRGARILWPPLFGYSIALPAMMLGGAPRDVERVAAFVPVAFAIASILLLALVASLFTRRRSTAFAAGLALAFIPAHVAYTALGRPDQHAAEAFFSCWVFGAFAAGLQPNAARRWRTPVLLGVGIALSFWNWMGSGVYLLLLAGFVGVWHVVAGDPLERLAASRLLARGATVAAVLLCASIALVSPQALLDLDYRGVTGFHVLLSVATAAFSAALWGAEVRWSSSGRVAVRRLAEVVGAGAVLLLAVAPAIRGGVGVNLAALGAASRWYASIGEFLPLLPVGGQSLSDSARSAFAGFGFSVFAVPLAPIVLVGRWRREGALGGRAPFLLAWGACFVVLTLARVRFGPYLSAPLAIWFAVLLESLASRLSEYRWRGSAALAAALPFVGALVLLAPRTLLRTRLAPVPRRADVVAGLTWLKTAPSHPGREAVLADWDLGHVVRYFAEKPVLATPFGTDAGRDAMADAARFYLAADPQRAEDVLRARRIGFLLVQNPLAEIYGSYDYVEAEGPELVRLVSVSTTRDLFDLSPAFWRMPLPRLYFGDGSATENDDALGFARLLYETLPETVGPPPLGAMKLFGVVPGANVSVADARPHAPVAARVLVVTNLGRTFVWQVQGRTDDAGRASFRVPFATGMNGLVRAGPCVVTDGEHTTAVPVTEEHVQTGARIPTSLGSAEPVAARRVQRP